MKKDNLKNYNKGQVALFKIIKTHAKTRNKLNKTLNIAISKNDVYEVILISSRLGHEISITDEKAHDEANRINEIKDKNSK
jgi:hypothetical protein